MYMLEVFRLQLIVLAYGAGLVITFITISIYAAYYKPRPEELPDSDKPTRLIDVGKAIPWVLLLTYIVTVALLGVGLWMGHAHPTNW